MVVLLSDLSQQFDFGTPGMKPWKEGDPFWQRLEGDGQVCIDSGSFMRGICSRYID